MTYVCKYYIKNQRKYMYIGNIFLERNFDSFLSRNNKKNMVIQHFYILFYFI